MYVIACIYRTDEGECRLEIASLHNLLYEAVTGERYDYMFHWANKVGGDCLDNIFDDDTEENKNE